MKKTIYFLLTVALIIGCVGCSGKKEISSNRTSFEIEYSKAGMEKFMNIVCKNVDGEADIIEAHEGDYYYTQAEIKLSGKVPELAEMRFYNMDDSDVVSWVQINIFDPKSDNAFNCSKELILAAERTLTGKTTADQYITTLNQMYNLAFSNDWDPVVVAEYELEDGLYARIAAVPSLGRSWSVQYRIMTEAAYYKVYKKAPDIK